jgi:signal transduction histidine kinase
VRRRRETEEELRNLRAELAAARHRLERLDEAEEQARIALELYDGIAHSLHTIATDAVNAEQPAIRREADTALGELDRLRRMLRAAEDEETERSLAAVASLVERARDGGMPVTLHVEGAPRRVPRSLDEAAFRIVQEALRSVHKHANGQPVRVRVLWREDAVGLQIRNSGPSAEDERGLTIMRERVAFHGGELRAGAPAAGGYEVTALLPL